MMTRFFAGFFAVLACLAAAADPPTRVIAMSPHLTDIVIGVGAGDKLVGVDTYSILPADRESIQRVGDLYNPNVERIVSLKPQMIFVMPTHQALTDQLTKLGTSEGWQAPEIVVCNKAETIAQVHETIALVGEKLGQQEGAKHIIGNHQRTFDRWKTNVEKMGPGPRVLIIMGRRPGVWDDLLAINANQFVGEMATMSGGINVLPTDAPGYAPIGLEGIASMAPDVILEVHGDSQTVEAMEAALLADWAKQPLRASNGEPPRIAFVWDRRITIPGTNLDTTMDAIGYQLRPDITLAESQRAE